MNPAQATSLPDGLLLAYYGDDFTGASAVMEVMTFAGLPTVLFLDIPTPDQLARLAGYRGIGIAGIARSQAPEWMERELPGIFAALGALGAPVTQYKICSTLDSSPHIGSIGKALDIAIPILSGREGAADWQPMVVAAPAIRRYQAFGNLFAGLGNEYFRLDRHPVMARHPVTPMDEADVRRHVARQTERAIGLVDLVAMKSGRAQVVLDLERASERKLVALDVIDEETLAIAGSLIWSNRAGGIFTIGSQGIEYALVEHWRQNGSLPETAPATRARPVEQIVAVSGSVSSVTAGQIETAQHDGFELARIDAAAAIDPKRWQIELARALQQATNIVESGKSPVVATAVGPDDPAISRLNAAIEGNDISAAALNQRIGEGLGAVLDGLYRRTGIRRAAVLGGDTSGHATRALGIHALEALAPITPGCPLCRAYSDDPAKDGMEIALKGGQMGDQNFLQAVRAGGAIEQRSS
ncbi:MAG TPA: four-carbon acid sugar kinase family protein [Devosiaceae bacterium]